MSIRIIIEVDGKEVATTTVHQPGLEATPTASTGSGAHTAPAGPPPEILKLAAAIGAKDAGPAPAEGAGAELPGALLAMRSGIGVMDEDADAGRAPTGAGKTAGERS